MKAVSLDKATIAVQLIKKDFPNKIDACVCQYKNGYGIGLTYIERPQPDPIYFSDEYTFYGAPVVFENHEYLDK